MSKVYIIMKTVDLGGHPVVAYSDRAKVEAVCDEVNRAATEEYIKSLMKNLGYSKEEAMRHAVRYLFGVNEIELKFC